MANFGFNGQVLTPANFGYKLSLCGTMQSLKTKYNSSNQGNTPNTELYARNCPKILQHNINKLE